MSKFASSYLSKCKLHLVGSSTLVSSSLTGCWASQGLFPPPLLIRVCDLCSIVVSQYKTDSSHSSTVNLKFSDIHNIPSKKTLSAHITALTIVICI